MKISLIFFTTEGAKTCRIILSGLEAKGHQCRAFARVPLASEAGVLPLETNLQEWTEAAFHHEDALVFIGAAGIAVRAIAPYVKDKTTDPAVVVADEGGAYVISLLSGHLGGANALAREIAALTEGLPVITTATDLAGKFAVDEWAKANGLQIGDMKLAKEISAAVLRGESIGVCSDFPMEGESRSELCYAGCGASGGQSGDSCTAAESGCAAQEDVPRLGFRISVYEEDGPFQRTLQLIPRTVTVGMGCRKGVSLEAAEGLLHQVLKKNRLSVKAIEKLCTIDIKKEEAALIQLAEKLGVPLEVFSPEELLQAEGEFSASEFVSRITGVDNVCERAAVLGSRGELLIRKQARDGVTVAAAIRAETFRFG